MERGLFFCGVVEGGATRLAGLKIRRLGGVGGGRERGFERIGQ